MAYIGNQPLATAVTNADISSSAAIDLSKLATTGDLSATNVTLGGYLRGPSTFTIDPAAHGDNTGTLVIAGNLQIDGTTTTVNSTTMTVDDKNITVASGAANAAAADGAGITVDGASATLLYNATPDAWSFNKNVGIGTSSPSRQLHLSGSTPIIRLTDTDTNAYGEISSSSSDGNLMFFADQGNTQANTTIRFSIDSSEKMRIDTSGNLLVGLSAVEAVGTSAGTQLRADGLVYAAATSDAHILARRSTDGSILNFRKDTTTIGSIDVDNGDNLTIQGKSDHSGLQFGTNAIFPHKNSANIDDTISLGESTLRFEHLFLSGNVNANALVHDGDDNTFIHFPSADTLAVNTGGSERMRIDSSGNLQLSNGGSFLVKDRGSILVYNTNDDNYARIQNTSASGNELQFSTNALAMTIDINGNVGIGQEPQAKFSVYSAASGVVARIDAPNAYNSESGLEFSVGRARISGVLNSSGGTPGASLKFMTMPDGGSITERLRLSSTGNAMLGTTSDEGASGNTKKMVAGHFTTKNGVTSIPSTGVATTLHSFASNAGNFIVSALASGTGNIEDNTTAIIHINASSTSKITTLLAGSRVVLSMSGTNLQVTQSVFNGANINWSVMRIR